jgi:hypothetical protein
VSAVRVVLACALACACWPAVAQGEVATAAQVRPLAAAAAQRDAAAARAQARDILDQRRFQETKVPAPLRHVRERIGAALRSAGRPLESAFGWLAEHVPGGRAVVWALLATFVLGSAALFASRAGARPQNAGAGAGAPGEERMSAARLRQEAERAERRGDLDEALRLRFRAGLVELDSRDLIALRPALTNRELLGAVPSPTLAELVDGFEAVAYGGRAANEDDVRGARDGWPRVPEEADSR